MALGSRGRWGWGDGILSEGAGCGVGVAGGGWGHSVGRGWGRGFLILVVGTPKIYTTTGFGFRKNSEMASVDDLVVYMQTAVKYSSLFLHHFGGASRPRGGAYRKCCNLQQFAYTPPNRPHQPFPYFF